MASEIDNFREYLNSQAGAGIVGLPATEQEITDFEAQYSVRLPADVREYFLKINGAVASFAELQPLSEWCLPSELKYYNSVGLDAVVSSSGKYLHIGTYDISVWDWFIRLDSHQFSETPVFVTVDFKITKVADSFSDFLREFRINGPEDLLGYR